MKVNGNLYCEFKDGRTVTFVRAKTTGDREPYQGIITIGNLYFPKEMIGKRVRFKAELVE